MSMHDVSARHLAYECSFTWSDVSNAVVFASMDVDCVSKESGHG